MGTNYYTVPRKPSLHRQVLHIGKASAGWKFVFQGYQINDENETLNIKSIQDWKDFIKNNDLVIFNEYNEEVSYDEFFELIESLQSNENKDNFTRDANIDGYRFNFEEFS